MDKAEGVIKLMFLRLDNIKNGDSMNGQKILLVEDDWLCHGL